MPDLDWSNVHNDVDFAYGDFLNRLFITLDRHSSPELQHLRYRQRIEVHKHNHVADIDCLLMIESILLTRLATTLCEGCLGRTGCDICCPPNFTPADMYPEYDPDTAHYERFGRPAFPNEY